MGNYGDYLHSDSCDSFGVWLLGDRLPEFEIRNIWPSREYEYRMIRRSLNYFSLNYYDIAGDWKPTKRAAKASYKEALKKRRSAQHD